MIGKKEGKPDARPLRAEPVITGDDAFPPKGTYRRPQGLAHHLIVLTLGGQAWIGPEGKGFAQQAGDVLLVDPGHATDQAVDARRAWRRTWAIFDPRPAWYEWMQWPRLAPGYRSFRLPSVRRGSAVREHLAAAHAHATGPMHRRGELAMNALEAALLWCDLLRPEGEHARLDPRVRAAMDFICRRLDQPMSLERIADAAGLSVTYLVKLFRGQLRTSPMQFVERRRMQRAGELLAQTPQTISEIAAGVGYEDPFYFSTRFKRYADQSPRAYRAARQAARNGDSAPPVDAGLNP